MKKAITLLSGGIDSTTTMGIAKSERYQIYALSFNYGQKNKFELEAAKNISKNFKVKQHLIINIDLAKFEGSALTSKIQVPEYDGRKNKQIPVTYVPARNTIFLSYALGWAESLELTDIFFGANIVDYSGYPDCRPEYVSAFEKVAKLGTRQGILGKDIKIHTPIINMSKSQIIKKGIQLGIDYSKTHSCYNPIEEGLSCGVCESCVIRKEGFKKAGIPDPMKYKRFPTCFLREQIRGD